MINYIQSYLNSFLQECKIIPYNWYPTKFYTISFDGWSNFTLTVDDPTYNEVKKMITSSLKTFVKIYGKTHAFSEPQLVYQPEKGTLCIRIGTLETEEYERRMLVDK